MEYLVKDPETGKYWETTDKFERNIVVEIPEGAELLTASGQELIFWKDNGQLSYHIENSSEWDAAGNGLCDLNGYLDKSVSIVWQREKVEVEVDCVNQPSHYTSGGIECLDAMQAMLSKDEFIGFLRGNVFKYNWRYKLKNGIEDLKKAKFYQDKLIEVESK